MPSFIEGRFQFDFEDSWVGVKYDSHPVYDKIKFMKHNKGVDFVGIYDRTSIFLEIKDFSDKKGEDAKKIQSGELAKAVAKPLMP